MRPIKIKTRSTFLKKHNRLVTFVGALIVFTTFVVKDAIRDELKSTVDDEKSAEAMFFDWSRQDDTDQMLNDVEKRLDALDEVVRPHSKSTREDLDRRSQLLFNNVRSITAETKRFLELAAPLVDHLPPSERDKFSDLERRLEGLRQKEVTAGSRRENSVSG